MERVDTRRERATLGDGGEARIIPSRPTSRETAQDAVAEGGFGRVTIQTNERSAVEGGVRARTRAGDEQAETRNFGKGSSRVSSREAKNVDGDGEEDRPDASMFSCNICMEMANYAVVTLCGHLYCWPCLYRWLHTQKNARTCPVCKAGVDRDKVIPVYGRGGNEDPRTMDGELEETPPRPLGQRPAPVMLGRPGLPAGLSRSHPAYAPSVSLFGGGYGGMMTPEQQHQAFLSRLLLMLGSIVIVCLLFM